MIPTISSARSRLLLCLVTLLGALTWCRYAGSATRVEADYFPMPSTGGAQQQQLPFSEAVKVGTTLYLAGQIGNLPGTTTLAPGGIIPEARRALDNIKAVVERHGASMNDIVKCTVFLADIKDWPAFNEVYRSYFSNHFPARSALAASGLAFDARVEVDCVASVPGARGSAN
jgi:2-iminobutanoate/2-iminopropanoate deaminase